MSASDSAQRAGQTSLAAERLRAQLQNEPDHIAAWNGLAELSIRSGHFESAIQYLQRVIALDGPGVALYLAFAQGWEGIGSLRQALEFCELALILDPRAPVAREQADR